jgi:hypothetical protein
LLVRVAWLGDWLVENLWFVENLQHWFYSERTF